jgi:hypothetical protein
MSVADVRVRASVRRGLGRPDCRARGGRGRPGRTRTAAGVSAAGWSGAETQPRRKPTPPAGLLLIPSPWRARSAAEPVGAVTRAARWTRALLPGLTAPAGSASLGPAGRRDEEKASQPQADLRQTSRIPESGPPEASLFTPPRLGGRDGAPRPRVSSADQRGSRVCASTRRTRTNSGRGRTGERPQVGDRASGRRGGRLGGVRPPARPLVRSFAFARPPVRPSARPPVRPSARSLVRPFAFARPPVRPSARPPARPPVRPSARLRVRPVARQPGGRGWRNGPRGRNPLTWECRVSVKVRGRSAGFLSRFPWIMRALLGTGPGGVEAAVPHGKGPDATFGVRALPAAAGYGASAAGAACFNSWSISQARPSPMPRWYSGRPISSRVGRSAATQSIHPAR